MSEKKEKNYRLRAMLPTMFRMAGVVGCVIAVLVVGIGFYFASAKKEFRGKEFPAKLSENVIGIVNGYQRKESENGLLKFFLKADVAKTFDDNHQELTRVSLQLFKDGDEAIFDRIVAENAVYIPEKGTKQFTIFFAGNVDIDTQDGLEVNTDQLSYKSGTKIARAEEDVTFRRNNISGSSFGATVDLGMETIELHKDIDIQAFAPSNEGDFDLDLKTASLRSGYAFVDSKAETIKLRHAVSINLVPEKGSAIGQATDISSNFGLVQFVDRKIKRIELEGDVRVKQNPSSSDPQWLKTHSQSAEVLADGSVERLSLVGNVTIETNRGGAGPLRATSDSAVYQRAESIFELRDRVVIVGTNASQQALKASASHAIYKQSRGEVTLEGGAEVTQGNEQVRGAIIFAKLSPDNSLNFAKAEQNAYLKQNAQGRLSEVYSDTMSAWFSGGKILKKAEARGSTEVTVVPESKAEYSKFRMTTPKGIDLSFMATGSLNEMTTLGRSTLYLDAGTDGSSLADKKLTADIVKTFFRNGVNELSKAQAIGDAELVVEPKAAAGGNYNTVINSPRFDCDFYAGNSARNCVSVKRSKVKRDPAWRKGPAQYLEADALNSVFARKSRNIEMLEASGNAKFKEGEKNGIAEKMIYTTADETVRFRGGSPTFWDNRARAKAAAIDWNTKDDVSNLSGGVSTTYYNQAQTGNSTPFGEAKSPVFVTSDSAMIEHDDRQAVYAGGARVWQEKNYVRGNKIYIDEKAGRFFAEGKVESILYDAKRTAGGKTSKLPVFVSANSMLYLRDQRQLRYEKSVDIRQGADRIVGNAADIFLQPDNTLSRSIVTGDVVITQPNRKATGDYAEHDAVNESIVVKGSPAFYSDSTSGSSTGKILTVNLKNNTAVNSGSDRNTGTGRIRSVYKVKPGRVN